jgi:hypothetical protein
VSSTHHQDLGDQIAVIFTHECVGIAAPTFVKAAVMGGNATGAPHALPAFLPSSSSSSHSTPSSGNVAPQHFFPSTPTMGGQSISKPTTVPSANSSSTSGLTSSSSVPTPSPAEPPVKKATPFSFMDDDEEVRHVQRLNSVQRLSKVSAADEGPDTEGRWRRTEAYAGRVGVRVPEGAEGAR